VDKNTEEEALVIKCMDEVKSQYVDWYNLGYQTCMAEKKPWVGLTDEECEEIQCDYGHTVSKYVFLAVEAKLKEKNT
jgi:hypothetical protein